MIIILESWFAIFSMFWFVIAWILAALAATVRVTCESSDLPNSRVSDRLQLVTVPARLGTRPVRARHSGWQPQGLSHSVPGPGPASHSGWAQLWQHSVTGSARVTLTASAGLVQGCRSTAGRARGFVHFSTDSASYILVENGIRSSFVLSFIAQTNFIPWPALPPVFLFLSILNFKVFLNSDDYPAIMNFLLCCFQKGTIHLHFLVWKLGWPQYYAIKNSKPWSLISNVGVYLAYKEFFSWSAGNLARILLWCVDNKWNNIFSCQGDLWAGGCLYVQNEHWLDGLCVPFQISAVFSSGVFWNKIKAYELFGSVWQSKWIPSKRLPWLQLPACDEYKNWGPFGVLAQDEQPCWNDRNREDWHYSAFGLGTLITQFTGIVALNTWYQQSGL